MKITVTQKDIEEILELRKYINLYPAVIGEAGLIVNGKDVSDKAFQASLLNAKQETIDMILNFKGKLYITNGHCGHLESGTYANIKYILSMYDSIKT